MLRLFLFSLFLEFEVHLICRHICENNNNNNNNNNNGTGGDSPNYSIIEIGQNTEKSPGDLKRLQRKAISWRWYEKLPRNKIIIIIIIIETIQITVLLRLARMLRRVLETWRDFLSLMHQWKTGEYLNLVRALKKQQLWNMRMTVVPIVVGALGAVSKSLEKE